MKHKRKFFNSSCGDGSEFEGLEFQIIGKISDNEYLICFKDGSEINAYDNEVWEVQE